MKPFILTRYYWHRNRPRWWYHSIRNTFQEVLWGWLTCVNCNHKLKDHVSYDYMADWNGICIHSECVCSDEPCCENFSLTSGVDGQ